MATVNELVTALGFELKPDALKNINNFEVGISHLQDAVGKLGRMLTGGLSMKDYFSSALGRSQDIMNSAKAIGMSTDALQEWQYAAKASGVSAESVISDIENLRANFFMTEKGMLRLADSFKRMSAGGAYWYGNMYGLSKDTVLMLRQGSAALKQMQDEAHKVGAITPQEEIEKAAKLNAELEKRKVALQKVVDTIILKVAPVVEKMLKKFDEWMAADPGRAQLVIEGITAALVGLASSEILSGLGAVVNLVKSLALGILNAGPLALILAGVGTAAIAMYKDFQNYKENGESIIPWEKLIKGAENAKKELSDFSQELQRMWRESPEWMKTLIKGFGESLVDAIHSAYSALEELMGGLMVLLDWTLTDRTVEGLKKRLKALHEGVWEWEDKKEKDFLQPLTDTLPNIPMKNQIVKAGGEYLFQKAFDKMKEPKAQGYYATNNAIGALDKLLDQTNPQVNGSDNQDWQSTIYNMANKAPSEISIKSSSINSLAEVLRENAQSAVNMVPSTITKSADFNGANINIITGATSEDIIDALTAMGGDVNNSFNGTGFIY